MAHYQMDAGSGQVTDSSGNGNQAVLGNTNFIRGNRSDLDHGDDRLGLLFNGSNDVATIPHKAPLDNLKKFTISAWINPAVALPG